jgi:hypothetical protein
MYLKLVIRFYTVFFSGNGVFENNLSWEFLSLRDLRNLHKKTGIFLHISLYFLILYSRVKSAGIRHKNLLEIVKI